MVRRKKTPIGPPPRRKKGTGSVYQRKSDGRWAGEFDDSEGNRHIIYADSYEEADRLILAEIEKVKAGTFVAPDRITVGEWLLEWFNNTKSPAYRPNSRYRYGVTLKSRLIAAIGDIQLQKLTSRELQALTAKWANEELKASTIHKYFGLLSFALDGAVDHRIISENPCKRVKLPKIEKSKKNALTLDQAQLLLIEINDHWLRPWVIIAVGTGMRVGELTSVRWEDIDFTNRVIHVGRNVARLPGEYVEGPPKTEAGRRDIIIPDFVEEELRAQQRWQLLKKGECGLDWNKDGLVLPHTEHGGYRNPDVVNPTFQEKLKQAELPIIPFHGLRHSAVRIMQVLGVPIEVIQQILGHGSIEVTAGIYGEVSISMQESAMGRVSEAWKRGQKRAN